MVLSRSCNLGMRTMIGLYTLIESELKKRDWKASDLAANSELSEATISRIKNNPSYEPDLGTLAAVAIGLDIPLRRVVEACGYNVDAGAANADDTERAAAIIRAVPDLRIYVETLASLRPDDRLVILSVAEKMAAER